MSEDTKTKSDAPDLFRLTQASIQVLIEDLKREATLTDLGGPVPPRAEQVAGLALAESIRLIRMGTRAEIARASDELSQLLIARAGERLKEDQEEAHRLLAGAAVALGAATPASSKGGAATVMRSWNGKAREVVKLVLEATGEQAPRSVLRAKVGVADESHFSHLLADLEAARLIVRVRTGKEILVRLGPTGRSEEVRRELADGKPIFPHGLQEPRIEGGNPADRRNDPGPRHLRLVPATEQAGLATVAENEGFAAAGNTTTSTLGQVTKMNRLDAEVDEPFGDAMSAADPLLPARQSLAN
jgi:hypothetical protein